MAFFHGLNSYGTRGDQLSFNQTDITAPELAAKYAKYDQQKNDLKHRMHAIEEAAIKKMSGVDQRRSETRER